MADSASKYEELENIFRDRLADNLSKDVSVEVEPEFEGQNKPVFLKTRVTIFCSESEFVKTKSLAGSVAQDENAKVFFLVRSKKLRGENGIYHVCDRIRALMVGFVPNGWEKSWMVKIGLEDRIEGVWHYTVVLATKSMIAEESEEAEIPKLTQPTADHEDAVYNV